MPDTNNLLAEWNGAPPFDIVRTQDFLPAFAIAISDHAREIDAIAHDPAPATFENTLAALERAGATLGRVQRLFWTLSSAQSDDAMRAIEGDVSALLTRHGTGISHNKTLFDRIAAVHAAMEDLSPEQRRLTTIVHDGFVADGAALTGAPKQRFAAIGERLAQLSVTFGHNVMAATNAWSMDLTEADLDGLPQPMRAAAHARAGKPGTYRITLDRTDYENFLAFSARRDLREKLWRAFTARCAGGDHDNGAVMAETLTLRAESAALLGYSDYASYKLSDSMAATPDAAEALLLRLWEPAKISAAQEAAELQALIDAEGETFTLAPWDWRFYAERVRRDRYALDGAAVARHLTLGAVRTAAFNAAARLYGLAFVERPDLPVWHKSVSAWAVTNGDGSPVGLLYTDYLARPEKHGGAWMGSIRVQESMDGDVRPIVYTVANFAGDPDPAQTSLSLDEARTLFHEFGHALHGLLSNVTYPSLSGTAVPRDFVEFPSKFMEHWIIDREVLSGFGVPAALIDAIEQAEHYGQGFATVELVGCALVDLALHRSATPPADPIAFGEVELKRIGMPEAIDLRHRLPYFTHVFDGGYASAYYSYLWSEALDADAFDAFLQAGMFDAETALRFRDEILAPGNSRDPMDSFKAFRGRAPEEEPLLKARGLLETA